MVNETKSQVTHKKTIFIVMLILFSISLSAFADDVKHTDKNGRVVMIVAKDRFRDEELFVPKKMFENAKLKVTIASTATSAATGMLRGTINPDVLLKDVRVQDYDAIVFVGGVGAKMYFDDKIAHKIVQDAVRQNKVLCAICIAPNILAKAGVLKDKNATCWGSAILTKEGAKYQLKEVVTDGKIITANGPNASSKFAETIIEALSDVSSNKANAAGAKNRAAD